MPRLSKIGSASLAAFGWTSGLSSAFNFFRSLRFRSSASAYLSRTPATTTNQTTFTFSLWLKTSVLNTSRFYVGRTGTNFPAFGIMMNSSGIVIDQYTTGAAIQLQLVSSAVYRDPSAWYHLVVAFDTTQATASNRIKVYVNGQQVTAFSTATYPAQNLAVNVNTTSTQFIGADTPNGTYFDCYMTEFNFIDGQQLAPTAFGTFNNLNVWQPIAYAGTYGTNGFRLPFNSQAASYAGLFNGSSQYLATTNTQIIPATGDFTVEVMVYKTNTNAVLYSQGTTGNAGRLEVTVIGTGLGIQIGAGSFSSTAVINNNQWYYIAFTRTGSTGTFYVNGIAAGTGTLSAAVQTTPFWIGLDWTSTYFGGYMSNLRVSNVVRTISTTSPTSSFTSDANTVFLTLQSSTVVDNSSNAYAITNNGTVTLGQTYPFAYNIFNDASPQANNWTPNNISGAFGSTLDYMTDVPTLTSATAANFATWNPITGGSSTCSDGNLAAVFAPINGARVSSIAVTDGKWYAEFVFTLINGYGVIGIGAPYLKGWTTSQESNANCVVKYSYTSGGTAVGSWTMPTSSLAFTIAINDVIGVALDMTTSTVTFYKNGTNVGNFTFTTGGSAVSFLMGNSDGSSNGAGYANFGQRPFAYTPPTGYLALNTFNL